jgi:alginate O-acetyltransferase complex protein AlgI
MLFNSIGFLIFLPIVLFLHWYIGKTVKRQNILLLLASYFFYACWDWRFLFLLVFSTLLDYYSGIKIHEAGSKAKAKQWLFISVIINLGFLGVFKYYDFFITSMADALGYLSFHPSIWTLRIILPVGISFYTFHGLSYVIDIYYRKVNPTRDFILYSLFVSFFPLLVAGPIERATHLLPQLVTKRQFQYSQAINGLRQMLWGFFKKVVIADNCAEIANKIFENYSEYSGSTLIFGAILFSIQIYCDFSGYSDIALGTARLFGVELLRNFAFPYFSRDIAEFWRRWHISLSSWFRDYLYIPLGGSHGSRFMKIRNTFVIFLVSGLWHGANWTFIVWGGIHALYFLPLLLMKSNRNNLEIVALGRTYPGIFEIFKIFLTFSLVTFAWIFFRSATVTDAVGFIARIFSTSIFDQPQLISMGLISLIMFLIVVEWIGREGRFALSRIDIRLSRPWRYAFYYGLIILILCYRGNEHQFIYFQF